MANEPRLSLQVQQNSDGWHNLKSLQAIRLDIGDCQAGERLEAMFIGVLARYVDSATWEHCLESARERYREIYGKV